MDDIHFSVETVFRRESGRIIASLIAVSGSFDRAEEAMQEAFASALASWPVKGIPDNPGAWITTTAHRKLIDAARREQTRRGKHDSLLYETLACMPDRRDRGRTIPHALSRTTGCASSSPAATPHSIPEAQIALTLRTLGGLSTPEIAKAFLVPEPTIAQRLVRAKRKIQEARIPYHEPSPARLPERLAAVQAVIYLIFNAGYSAASGTSLVRADLCAEAIRLGRLLFEMLPGEAENIGLLALMLLQDSRRNARVVGRTTGDP